MSGLPGFDGEGLEEIEEIPDSLHADLTGDKLDYQPYMKHIEHNHELKWRSVYSAAGEPVPAEWKDAHIGLHKLGSDHVRR